MRAVKIFFDPAAPGQGGVTLSGEVALGVFVGIAGVVAAFWLVATAISHLFPLAVGRRHIYVSLAAAGLPRAMIDDALVRAAAQLAWDMAQWDQWRMRAYTEALDFQASVLVHMFNGYPDPASAELYRSSGDALRQLAARRR